MTVALSPRYDRSVGFDSVVITVTAPSKARLKPAEEEVVSGFEVRLAVTDSPVPDVVTFVTSLVTREMISPSVPRPRALR